MTAVVREPWLWLAKADLEVELRQLDEEGRDVSPLRGEFERLIALGDEELFQAPRQEEAGRLLDAAQALPIRRDFPYEEPSGLAAIRGLRPSGPTLAVRSLPEPEVEDRVLGAWLGRCAGCLLGKPVEGKRTDELWGFLKASGQWPLDGYIAFGVSDEVAAGYPDMAARRSFDDLDHMPADDDTDYTVSGLLILEQRGASFTPADVGRFWMQNIPLLCTYTAERVAYRNLALLVAPPDSARRRNPYREWIGARIRADAWGYACVGDWERAAEFAWRDATVSHVKNGVYGEMMLAAMIAAAPFCRDAVELLEAGLSQVPRTSRLYADIRQVVSWRSEGIDYDEAVSRLHERWSEASPYDWCHTNSNTAICAVALLWGEGDFGKSICRAVQPGFDTDCNGATVGSIMGMMLGAKRIPTEWTQRLNNTLRTNLVGRDRLDIEGLAQRTLAIQQRL